MGYETKLAQFVEKMQPAARSLGILSGIGLAGIYLIVLSFCSVFFVVALLTAHQFQHAIRTAELKGEPVALWQIMDLRESWKTLQQGTANASKVLEVAQLELSAKSQALQKAREEANKPESDVNTLEIGLTGKLAALGVPATAIEDVRKNSPFYLRAAAYRSLAESPAASVSDEQRQLRETVKKEFELILSNYETALSSLSTSDDRVSLLTNQVEEARKSVASLLDESVKARTEFSKLLSSVSEDAAKRQLVGNFLSQLNALDGPWLGVLGAFATMEPDLLTLLLVLAMGTLGGTLHLARLYIDGVKTSFGYFLYRPFLGAIAALVIFVVARTGIFVVAEPSSQNSGAPLSPFFISFVAIVSGLLAEQAIASIQGTGEKWFAGSLKDNTERYAVRVSEEALKQKKDKAQLQKYAEMDEEHLRSLFNGSKKVPAHIQKIASVWLRKPVRELFTELPPAAGAK
jgi:hypothetical protein